MSMPWFIHSSPAQENGKLMWALSHLLFDMVSRLVVPLFNGFFMLLSQCANVVQSRQSYPLLPVLSWLDQQIVLSKMASDDDYTSALITAVAKRPLLYNVHLADYKNKNKKGEAFKEVQQEMRQAGCHEQQVQGTYKNSKLSGKRKFCFQSSLHLDEEESDEDRCLAFDDDDSHRESTLDQLLNQKRVKLENPLGDIDTLAATLAIQNSSSSTTDGSNRTPSPIFQNTLSADNGSTDQQSRINPLNLLSQQEIDSFQQKCQEMDKSCFAIDPSSLLFGAAPPSQNALFGQLVANELDKLAETTNINLSEPNYYFCWHRQQTHRLSTFPILLLTNYCLA
uniref:MADF domain-containing protein n=1 Tax=Ditylenchus dipsaci TaxID=166011 RepID=A0A915D5B3_9BILA